MRNAFIRGLTKLAESDERIVFLTGDLGYKLFDDFATRYPGRFLNAGVAEQNMVGVAAGLASEGFRPFVYSIATFATLRCLEQIRDDVCYNGLPVTIVGVGGGFSYGANGPTHHATEDLAIMRALPNMTVIAPGDPVEAEQSIAAIATLDGPAYLRLGRAGDRVVHKTRPKFQIGRAITVQNGEDCTLIATGGMLPSAVRAADLLATRNISARVVSMHTVKPLDKCVLKESCNTKLTVTLEEHSYIGGLGSAVSEWMAIEHIKQRLLIIAAKDCFTRKTGSQSAICKENGIDSESIAHRVWEKLK
jgi:transketolase